MILTLISGENEIDEIEIEEIERALMMMKNKKAVGDDHVPTELLKLKT